MLLFTSSINSKDKIGDRKSFNLSVVDSNDVGNANLFIAAKRIDVVLAHSYSENELTIGKGRKSSILIKATTSTTSVNVLRKLAGNGIVMIKCYLFSIFIDTIFSTSRNGTPSKGMLELALSMDGSSFIYRENSTDRKRRKCFEKRTFT